LLGEQALAALLPYICLAELVGAAHWRLFERVAAIDADHVSKLERGLITWPNKRYREALRAALGVDTDAELGFYCRRSRATVEFHELTGSGREVGNVRRNEFIRLMTGLGAGAGFGVTGLGAMLPDSVHEVLSLAVHPEVPARVGRTEVEQVREGTGIFRSWRGRYGGGACREAMTAQMRWAAGLLQGRTENSIRRDLHSAVGFLADVVGWNEVDAGGHETALRCFRLALHCAEEAADWSLRAEVLTDMSRQAVDRDQIDDAMSLIELAQVRADRVAGTGRAMMTSAHARVLGAAGRVTECRNAVAAAEDHFADHRPSSERSGSPFFQHARATDLAYDNSSALFYAGLHSSAVGMNAINQLRTVIDATDAVSRRRQAMSTVKLATLELLHGDPDEGITQGQRAFDLGDGVRSVRLTDDLRRLRTATTRHAGPSIDALQRHLDSLLKSA
jgi:hypothetical protein